MAKDILEILKENDKRYSVFEETYGYITKIASGLTSSQANSFVKRTSKKFIGTKFEIKEEK